MKFSFIHIISVGVRRGEKKGHLPPWKFGLKNQNFLEKLKSAA